MIYFLLLLRYLSTNTALSKQKNVDLKDVVPRDCDFYHGLAFYFKVKLNTFAREGKKNEID